MNRASRSDRCSIITEVTVDHSIYHANGWKPSRITPVSRSAIRLCIFEMKYMDDIPAAVSINEAIELVKTHDDPKMRTFVNGVLHGAKTELEEAAQ